VESSIVELSGLSREVLAAAYRRASLLVHTAEAEGFGLPLIEAMACGCPVIASDLPVLREVGGTAATYRAVGDIPGWTGAIVAALQGRGNRESGFANAARFSWSENVDRTSRVYKQVLLATDKPR
jgi:glycosyltransferase involved in cell wall biosynthesis